MVLAGLVVLVVDMAVQMRLGAESLVAPGMDAFVRAVVVPFVVVQFMDLLEDPAAFVAYEASCWGCPNWGCPS